MVLSRGKSNITLNRETTIILNCIPSSEPHQGSNLTVQNTHTELDSTGVPQMCVSLLGYHLTILLLGWHHSSSDLLPISPHNFYRETCQAWCGMVRYGVVPTKLKNRHLTLKQDLHC